MGDSGAGAATIPCARQAPMLSPTPDATVVTVATGAESEEVAQEQEQHFHIDEVIRPRRAPSLLRKASSLMNLPKQEQVGDKSSVRFWILRFKIFFFVVVLAGHIAGWLCWLIFPLDWQTRGRFQVAQGWAASQCSIVWQSCRYYCGNCCGPGCGNQESSFLSDDCRWLDKGSYSRDPSTGLIVKEPWAARQERVAPAYTRADGHERMALKAEGGSRGETRNEYGNSDRDDSDRIEDYAYEHDTGSR